MTTENGPGGPTPTADFEPARLVQARRLAGMSRADLEDATGIRRRQIGRWETSIGAPNRWEIGKLADALDQLPAFFNRGRPLPMLSSSDVHVCFHDGSEPITTQREQVDRPREPDSADEDEDCEANDSRPDATVLQFPQRPLF